MNPQSSNQRGFSLVEIMVALAILATLSLGVLGMFQFALFVIAENKARTGAISAANEVIETIRNLPYDQIGTVGGIVAGVIPQQDTILLNNINYNVETSVSYFDDPFDGTVALGTDSLGNDYKKIKITIAWVSQFGNKEISNVTTVAPKGIETNEGGGVLKINVIDANGQPVPEASIHIINNQTDPVIDDSSQQTNDDGYFYSSVPAAVSSYQIVITKNGYSSDYNCAIDPVGTGCGLGVGNPNPVKPQATVIEGVLTEVTFAIDRVATLNIQTLSQNNIPAEWIVNTDISGEDQRNPAIALGQNGQYYFSWQDFRNSAARIYSQRYNGQTPQWDPDLAITTANNQNGPDIAVGPDGNIYLTWYDDKNGNQDIYFNKYDSLGTELWGGGKKVNTDSGSADQFYPKISVSPATPASCAGLTTQLECESQPGCSWGASGPCSGTPTTFVYIAWKDNRAGGGNSDIYLQKFNGESDNLWSNEQKVNFASSALFQDIETFSWTFSNPLEYICDNGNCDGDTDVEVTTGKAQLVPIQSCQGTPNSCNTFLSQTLCQGQTGCSWDAAGPCENGACACGNLNNQTDCQQATACNWEAGASGCTGACDCWDIGNKGRCQSVAGCAWLFWFCYPTTGCNCPAIGSENTCEDASCNWGSTGGQCAGSCSCPDIATQPICSQVSCNWDATGPCNGTPNICTTFISQNDCENQNGCSWTPTGGYPSDSPTIHPSQIWTVNNLISWDSFTETATKNGGEIYYQLSDDGNNWKYWNGSTWQSAGSADYNTATVINANFNKFPTSKEKIMFQAFFASNGNQQVILDSIDISYTVTSTGGSYSQSVDLKVNDNDDVYVVWETYNVNSYDIFLQKINTNGVIVWANDVKVNATDTGDQTNPALALDSSGNIYLAWQDSRSGLSRIYMQKFDSDGNRLWGVDDILVSEDTPSGNQQNPKIILDQSGNIYFAWQDSRNGDSDIYIQKVDSDGNVIWPDDIRVNAETLGDQRNPDLLINQAGNLVVTWQDNKTGDYDIVAAEFAGDPSSTSPIPNVSLKITGIKQVGTNPIIYKYDEELTTDGSGNLTLNNLEWDEYSISLTAGSGYTIFSTEPPLPISLNPNETKNVKIILE